MNVIELTTVSDSKVTLVARNIASFIPDPVGTGTQIWTVGMRDEEAWRVIDDYDEIYDELSSLDE